MPHDLRLVRNGAYHLNFTHLMRQKSDVMRNEDPSERPRQLSDRFWRELCELLDQGEISPAVAERIRNDMFEPAEPGQLPILKWSVWCAHIEELQKYAEVDESRRTAPKWWAMR